MDALTPEQRVAALLDLPDWTYDERRNALFRQVVLPDFSAAFAVMTRIALAAEALDHHPEWFNVYNRIDIWLTTHDAGGVSTRDLRLAEKIDSYLPRAAEA